MYSISGIIVVVLYGLFYFFAMTYVPPKPSVSCPPVVFSHRAAVPASELLQSFDAPAPGSIGALQWIKDRGVCAFDVDCFTTIDKVLVVGHPTELAERLHLANSPDALSLEQIRDVDGGMTPTILDFLCAAAEVTPACPPSDAAEVSQRTPLRILIEPKGASASLFTIETLAAAVRESGFGDKEVGVWVSEPALADAAAATGVLTPLLPVKGSSWPPKYFQTHWAAVGPPVAHPNLGEISALVRHSSSGRGGAAVLTWVVDEPDQLQRAIVVADAAGVISNEPFTILANTREVCGR